jgi:hypothetical protein
MMITMAPNIPDRDECIEQTFFFRTFRERLIDGGSAQDLLNRAHEEILSTTRLPYAIQFLASELKHSGLLASGFAKLPHYFTPYQTFVVKQCEDERSRLTIVTAMLILEREAIYKSNTPTQSGLFAYQFESLSRNRLGYDEGLEAIGGDPFFSKEWKDYIDIVRRQVGAIDFSDLVYLRSQLYVMDQRRINPTYEAPVPVIFAEKEGKIAKASRGRDPLFLFAALQRQLGYPEVPRAKEKTDLSSKLEIIMTKLAQLEQRLKLTEGEIRGSVDLTEFGKPEMFRDLKDEA